MSHIELNQLQATYLESLLKDPRFHNEHWSAIPKISSWPIVTPSNIPVQNNEYAYQTQLHLTGLHMLAYVHLPLCHILSCNDDCGVFVGGWMALSSIWGDYETVVSALH